MLKMELFNYTVILYYLMLDITSNTGFKPANNLKYCIRKTFSYDQKLKTVKENMKLHEKYRHIVLLR